MNVDMQTMEWAGEIFCDALEIDSLPEREAYIRHACGDNEMLQSAVHDMMAAHAGAEELFGVGCSVQLSAEELTESLTHEPAFIKAARTIVSPQRELGQCIGPYRLVQKIGEGGGGNVYLAEQEHPVRRQVALKVLRLGTDTQRVIGRFEAERQVLATMEHSNIAHVLDAGETDEGLPYFVMELVRGVKITDYCDENGLNIRQREELFLQVCHAIQHAHQKGIIHRDIKPSNILITLHDDVPVPKVIDFGVAKAIGEESKDEVQVETVCDQFVGTPAYMSPEQAGLGGVDVDMRSDIYSLGVLLYELLIGKPPFEHGELLKPGLDNMLRILREREPPRPSIKVQSMGADERSKTLRCRNTDLRDLNHLLTGDLDWIVMKALEKDRERRYQSVDGLAEDVLHHLNHEPVKARPPSRAYRFQKLVRRNKAVFVSIAAVGLTLMAGVGTSSWLFVKERYALKEQVRLRQVAEQARRSESELREEAEVREKITQAAVLLRHGKPEEADLLVGESPVPVIKPSIEAADVFNQLGNWNIEQGRWHEAADRMLKLSVAMRVDQSDMTDEATRDLLRIAPVLVVAGDLQNYNLLVLRSVSHFADTTNPIAAEQLLKLSLIVPADESVMDSLLPLAEVVRQSIPDSTSVLRQEGYMAWRVLSLSLFEYRRGNYSNAVSLTKQCLDYPASPPTQIALCHLIQAMAYSRLHQSATAHSELAEARILIEPEFPSGLGKIEDLDNQPRGYWHDWVLAYILLGEADDLLHAASPSAE